MTTPTHDAAAVLAAICKRGVIPHRDGDLRDAAHEACHGLELNLRPPWSRERVHRAIMRRRIGEQVAMECTARAVEQIVCARCGVDAGDIKMWAFVTSMEALKNGVDAPINVFDEGTRRSMNSPSALALAERILALSAEGNNAS